MKTTIDRVGRIRRVALALWRRLNPSSAADDGPRSFEEAQPPGLTPAPEFWAGRWFDDAERYHRYHYAISGAPRSGKSLLLALYLRSVISQITPGSDRRLVIFDHNQMLHPALFENVQVPVHFFLPNHRLTSRWDLAGGDFASPAAVTQLCEALVPEVRGYGSIFFVQIARRLMADVIHSLNATQPGWSLADVVRILENQDSTADILARSNGTSSLLRYMDEPRTWANIAATEETHLGTPRDLAAMWSRASQTFSLRDFVRSEGILVLGRDPGFPALDRLNMLLFTQLFSQLLAQSDSATSRTHVVLDELPLAAGDRRPLSGLKDICERGASRGVVLAVTFRSYADMKRSTSTMPTRFCACFRTRYSCGRRMSRRQSTRRRRSASGMSGSTFPASITYWTPSPTRNSSSSLPRRRRMASRVIALGRRSAARKCSISPGTGSRRICRRDDDDAPTA